MRRPSLALFLSPAAALCAVACGADGDDAFSAVPGSASLAVDADMGRLVPPDALLYVQVASLDFLDGALRGSLAAASATDELPPGLGERMLEDLGLPEGVVGALDRHAPFAIALSFPEGPLPATTFVLPVGDEDALRTAADDGSRGLALRGGYAGLSTAPDYAASPAPAPLADELPSGRIAGAIDLRALVSTFRPMIDAGLDQLVGIARMTATASSPLDAEGSERVAELYTGQLRAALDSVEASRFAYDVAGSRIRFHHELEVRPESPLAAWSSDEPGDLARALRYRRPDASLTGAYVLDFPALGPKLLGWLDGVLAIYPEPARSRFSEMLGAFEPLLGELGHTVSLSYGVGPDGLQMTYYHAVRDADAALAILRDAVRPFEADGIAVRPLEAVEVAGVPAVRYGVDVTSEAFAEGADSEETQRMIESIYGAGGMQLTYGGRDGWMALVVGRDEARIEDAFAHLADGYGEPPPALARLAQAVEGASPAFVLRMDVVQYMRELSVALAPPGSEVDTALAAYRDVHAPMDVYAGARGTTWELGGEADLGELRSFVEMMAEL